MSVFQPYTEMTGNIKPTSSFFNTKAKWSFIGQFKALVKPGKLITTHLSANQVCVASSVHTVCEKLGGITLACKAWIWR